jgi:hypothetical protein
MQNLVVGLVVAVCFVYAAWILAPKAPRRQFTLVLLKLPLPAVLQKPLNAAARMQGGCGCDGCDAPVKAGPKPVVFMRKL